MNKILSILAVVIFAVAVVIALNNRRERIERMTLEREHKALMLENLQKLSALSTKWMIAESAITDMSGTLEVDITRINPSQYKNQYTIEKDNTRYIDFEITGGNHVKVDIYDQGEKLLRSFKTPYLFGDNPKSAMSELNRRNAPGIAGITFDVKFDGSGQFWPLQDILLPHLQPTINSSLLITATISIDLRSPERVEEISFRELDNGDIEIYYQRGRDTEGTVIIYRPNDDDRVVRIIQHPARDMEINSQWSGDLLAFGETTIFTHYSSKNSYHKGSTDEESTLIVDE